MCASSHHLVYTLEILVCITYSSSNCSFSRHYKYFQEEIPLTAHFYEDLFLHLEFLKQLLQHSLLTFGVPETILLQHSGCRKLRLGD